MNLHAVAGCSKARLHLQSLPQVHNCTSYQTAVKQCAYVKRRIVHARLRFGRDKVVMFTRKVFHGRNIGVLLVITVCHLLMTDKRRQVAPDTTE